MLALAALFLVTSFATAQAPPIAPGADPLDRHLQNWEMQMKSIESFLAKLERREIAKDGTVRGTALAELEAMTLRSSQYNPGHEIPEKNLLYRLAKRYWFNDFGAYAELDKQKSRQQTVDSRNANAGERRGVSPTCLQQKLDMPYRTSV